MPAPEGWDLHQFHEALLARARRLCLDARIQLKESPSDIVQETYARALRSDEPCRATNDGERLAYLFRIMGNAVIDKARAYHGPMRNVDLEQRWQQALDDSAAPWTDQVAGDGRSPLSEVLERERRDWRMTCLQQLPEREREAVTLHLEEELTPTLIGGRLGITKGAAAGLLHRGLERLADLMRKSDV
jgi:RNA polymerase sigma-70 factor, ECF subfamily